MGESESLTKERILFQNEACVVINKLPGESSQAPALKFVTEIFPVHRLDMPVSGCLLLARNAEAAAFLGEAFARPAAGAGGCSAGSDSARVEKCYWAIVEKPRDGVVVPAETELVHWLYEDKKTNKAFALPWEKSPLKENAPARKGSRGGGKERARPLKKAVLRYRLVGQGDNYLFLEIDLVTGRHHQIRAQLAAAGLHVKGDLKYGARRSEKAGGIRLHARSLIFPNPLERGETIRAEAPPPAMDALWRAFAERA